MKGVGDMATTEYIQKRVVSKKAEIDKLNKKMDRILEAKASDWQKNPYCYNESDIKRTQRDLDRATEALKKLEGDLAVAIEKDNSRNVKPILDFLEVWKANCYEWYMKGMREYFEEKALVQAAGKKCSDTRYGTPEHEAAEAEYKALNDVFFCKCHGYKETKIVKDWRGRDVEKAVKVRDGEYERYFPYTTNFRTLTEAEESLKKDLVVEANRKYDDIIERTNDIIGEITDASWLTVDPKGNLNGFIIGKRGNAKVETIGAGGYNIQCFHFRCLIHKYDKPLVAADKAVETKPAKATKAQDTKDYKSRSIEELKAMVESLGATCRVYENEAIYRMRLVMAIKAATKEV